MSIEVIRKIFESVPAMISEEEGLFLYNLASKCTKGAIVEIGSDAGGSTICLAKGSKSGGNMTVYAIDPYNGGGPTPDPTWSNIDHDGTPDPKYYMNQGKSFSQFQQALWKHRVDDIVAPMVDYSELVYKKGWSRPIELLFIDGDHRYNYVKMDIKMWAKHLISGGIILMHDSTSSGVRRVINELIISNPRFANIKESPIFNATVKIKYLIFGNGFIGNKFHNCISDSSIAEGRINTINDVYLQIEKYNPYVIINCIGKTGRPNVDWCEDHKEETFFSNVNVPTFIAEACRDKGIYMVHIGSGCIYESDMYTKTGYSETDKSNFKGSFYSRTKIFSEQILSNYDNILQIRIRMPVDNGPSPRNLITKLVGYKQVINIPNSVTCLSDLIEVTKKLIDRRETGIFNVVNTGYITHEEILEMYKNIVDNKFEMPIFIPIEKLNTVAKRSNCILYNTRLESIGIKMRNVKDAIRSCMEVYKMNI